MVNVSSHVFVYVLFYSWPVFCMRGARSAPLQPQTRISWVTTTFLAAGGFTPRPNVFSLIRCCKLSPFILSLCICSVLSLNAVGSDPVNQNVRLLSYKQVFCPVTLNWLLDSDQSFDVWKVYLINIPLSKFNSDLILSSRTTVELLI